MCESPENRFVLFFLKTIGSVIIIRFFKKKKKTTKHFLLYWHIAN